MKVNDVYKFRYNEDYTKQNFEPYHCFDGILVVRKGKNDLYFEDTFWSSDTSKFPITYFENKGDLTFLCNLDNVEEISEYYVKYYDDVIILGMHKGYHTKYYIQKGQQRSKSKIIKEIEKKIFDDEETVKYALDRIERSKKLLEEINNGKNINEVYI